MPFTHNELNELLRQVKLTQDRELTCDECLALVAEFAEQRLVGQSLVEGLQAVEQHLSVCSECRDEYEALRRTLSDIVTQSNG